MFVITSSIVIAIRRVKELNEMIPHDEVEKWEEIEWYIEEILHKEAMRIQVNENSN